MNVPIWLLAVAPPVFGALGFLLCAMFTAGKVSDNAERDAVLFDNIDSWSAAAVDLQVRINRLKSIAASQQSVKSGRIVAVLDGEQS